MLLKKVTYLDDNEKEIEVDLAKDDYLFCLYDGKEKRDIEKVEFKNFMSSTNGTIIRAFMSNIMMLFDCFYKGMRSSKSLKVKNTTEQAEKLYKNKDINSKLN